MEEFVHYNLEAPVSEEDFTSDPRLVRTDKDFSVKEFYTFSDVEMQVRKGQKVKVFNITQPLSATYQVANIDYIVSVNDVGVSRTVYLPIPSLVGPGKVFVIKDGSGSALTTTITISPNGASDGAIRIDGDTSNVIATNFGVRNFFTDGGSNWFTF